MNYYEHHLGDYDGATAHLSWLEDCAYRRLICLYYRNEAPIPADIKQACRLVRASTKAERDAVGQVLAEFFHLQDDGWHHKRCDADLDRYHEKSRKARESVSKRWANRDASTIPTDSERNTNVDTNVSEAYNERNTPRARPQSPDTRPNTSVPSGTSVGRSPKGSRLPPDWTPGDSGDAFAVSIGLQPGHVAAELAKFRDFWAAKPGKDGTKLDWQATWRNWLRSALERAPRASGAQPVESFRERDERAAAEKAAAFMGRTPPAAAGQSDFIDVEARDVTARQLG